MYNKDIIEQLTQYIFSQNGIADKALLQSSVQQKFHLIKERSVFYCEWFPFASAKQLQETLAIQFYLFLFSTDTMIDHFSFAWSPQLAIISCLQTQHFLKRSVILPKLFDATI